MSSKSFLVLGAGRMAEGIVYDLLKIGATIHVWDISYDAVHALQDKFNWNNQLFGESRDLSDPSLYDIPDEVQVIISTLPYDYSVRWTKRALEDGCDFIDLGGNNDVVAQQRELEAEAVERGCIIVPDCGLAPGVVSILAQNLLVQQNAFLARPGRFSIEMSVGGLPMVRNNPLEYQVVFSPHGLINEYIEPTIVLENGELVAKKSMYGVEDFSMPWGFENLERFYTSGGASSLPESLRGVCKNVSYKTIRYKGHAEKMRMLLELFLQERELFEKLLQEALPLTGPDVILLDVSCYEHDFKDPGFGYHRDALVGRHRIIEYGTADTLTAMAKMTAFPAAIIAQALATNVIHKHGVLRQEELFDDPSYMVKELKKRGINFI